MCTGNPNGCCNSMDDALDCTEVRYRDLLARCREVIEAVEYPCDDGPGWCRLCFVSEWKEHAPDCVLAAVKRDLEALP